VVKNELLYVEFSVDFASFRAPDSLQAKQLETMY